MAAHNETRNRSIAKALSWRLFASLTTVLIVFIFTGKLMLSIGVGGVELVVKLTLYYFHERIWSHINFGKSQKEKR